MRQATAAELRKNTAGIIRAPRRMPVAEAVHKYMRVTGILWTVKACHSPGLMAGQLPTMTQKPCVTSLNIGKGAGALSQTAAARSNSLTFCKANHGIF